MARLTEPPLNVPFVEKQGEEWVINHIWLQWLREAGVQLNRPARDLFLKDWA